jgi:hypothetical protein
MPEYTNRRLGHCAVILRDMHGPRIELRQSGTERLSGGWRYAKRDLKENSIMLLLQCHVGEFQCARNLGAIKLPDGLGTLLSA